MGVRGWGESLQITPWGPLKAGVQGPADQRETQRTAGAPGNPSSFIQLPICQMGKLRPRERRGSWPTQHSRFSPASSHEWGQMPPGAWATSVACRAAQLRGRQSEPGNVGGWKGPLVGVVLRRGGVRVVILEQHSGGLAVPRTPIQNGEGLRGEGPQGYFPALHSFLDSVTKPAMPPATLFLGASLPFCFQCDIPGEQNTPAPPRPAQTLGEFRLCQ